MGEEPWRITISGEPGLDNLSAIPDLSTHELEQRVGMSLEPAPLLVTFHPVTLELGQAERQIAALLVALDRVGIPVVLTAPNADTEGRVIARRIQEFVEQHQNSRLVTSLGPAAYFSIMRRSPAMVGNSSSGIIEAASFELPVVNIGARQRGRFSPRNVIHCEPLAEAIEAGIRRAVSPNFRSGLRGLENPYGDGKAASRIINVLKTAPLDGTLLKKPFFPVQEVSSWEPVAGR
jgi:UDP-hydrolysing UDP-N-acetyl-D-glucosamine 2-epimerase